MARPQRTVTVAGKTQLSPHFVRLQLTGASLSDFPIGYEGGYVKLVFPLKGSVEAKPLMRSFTVRAFDAPNQTLTLDAVAHGDTGGPAANWIQQTREGHEIQIVGPGACQPINAGADWFLLAGDMSAIPAISVNLRQLSKTAKGHVVLEVISEADCIELDAPDGIEVHWIINPEPEQPNSMLEDYVMSLPWQSGTVSVWVAGEFSASRALRQYFRHDKAVARDKMYVSCYWKVGTTDEGMKAAKQSDPEP